jgi:uncharacterized delta-60 repeat protein
LRPIYSGTFGNNGEVRLGVPTGFEDKTYASALQGDGKLLVAGTSTGRKAWSFVIRFEANGAPDTTFGVNGCALLALPEGYFWSSPIQIEVRSDGSLLLVGILYNGFVLTRLTASGVLDTSFGTGGMVVVTDAGAFRANEATAPIRAATQADGKVLVVTDASSQGNFALRFRRFLAQGAADTAFGANGERVLANLPPNFALGTHNLAVTEPAGGFTLAANATFTGGTYLLLRVNGEGALDPLFGSVGYRSGYDLGNPHDVPTRLARTAGGGYALSGIPTNATGSRSDNDVVWQLDTYGVPVVNFGANGRVVTSYATGIRALVLMPDGGVATTQSVDQATIRISRLDASGTPASAFNGSGNMTIAASGYQGFEPVGIHADITGRLTVAGWGYATTIFSGMLAFPRGADVVLASVTSAGVPRTDFGRGDGIAVWNNPSYSGDRIDAVNLDASGRIVLAGFSDGSGRYDYLLSRLGPDGALDTTYGDAGRLNANQTARFTGIARAVQQPDGAMVVVGGEAFGSLGTIRGVTVFRATANGAVDSSFRPGLVAAGPNATVGLGVRPNGRLLYGTVDPDGAGSNVLQQVLPDGSPDTAFGTNGRVVYPAESRENTALTDLVVLADGSVVFAVFGGQSLWLYKVDANGAPVLAFGEGGRLVAPTGGTSFSRVSAPRLLALADGTLLAAHADVGAPLPGAPASDNQRSLFTVRATADGRVISINHWLPGPANLNWSLAALPDSSVIIARTRGDDGTKPALYRLLPDDQFDAAFGSDRAYVLSGFGKVTALALDASGRLLVAGQDAQSAVMARYQLSGPVAAVNVVEYYNVDLRHYFMTANPAEMTSIETGGAGPGWQRTGYGFGVYVPEAGVPIGARPVCRFYGAPGIGPNSHFYTADADECTAVKRDRGWTYEGTAFYVLPAINLGCAAGAPPVFRAYNNRFPQNDSNHRYATNRALLEALQPQGWSVEGVVFCAPPQ